MFGLKEEAGIALTPVLSFRSHCRVSGTGTIDLQRLKVFLRASSIAIFDSRGTHSQHP